MSDLTQFAGIVAAMFWTYLVHSTFFLASCALIIYVANPKSYALVSWCWKSAASLPIATSALTLVLSGYSMQFGYVVKSKSLAANQPTLAPAGLMPKARHSESIGPQIEGFAVERSATALELREAAGRNRSQLEIASGGSMTAANPIEQPLDLAFDPVAISSFAVVAVIGCTLFCFVAKRIRFSCSYRKLLRSSTECRTGVLHRELESLLKSNAIRRPVSLLISDVTTQPFAMGVLRWTIVVPRQVEFLLDKRQLSALFAHEVGHLVRRDLVWILIGDFLCTFLAFQPLNFLARRRWLDAAEFLADEWALRSGVTPLSLVRCLARVAEWQPQGMVLSVMPFANSSTHALTRRAEHLLSYQVKRDAWSTARCLSANVALTSVGLLSVFFGPSVGELRARETESMRSFEGAEWEVQLNEIAHQLRDVVANLEQSDLHARGFNDADELTVRVGQLKRRGAQLVERAELLSELCKKDLP